jgi:hypothetical protein
VRSPPAVRCQSPSSPTRLRFAAGSIFPSKVSFVFALIIPCAHRFSVQILSWLRPGICCRTARSVISKLPAPSLGLAPVGVRTWCAQFLHWISAAACSCARSLRQCSGHRPRFLPPKCIVPPFSQPGVLSVLGSCEHRGRAFFLSCSLLE